MANGGGRSIAPVRRVLAAVLGALGAFVVLFGAGMTSWAIVALGGALLVLAVSLVVVTAVRGGERAWVAGTAHVYSASEPPASSTYGRCELQIVVEAPGVPPAAIRVRDPRVPVAKWPDAGDTLPIMVAIDDQRHVRIQWDDVLTHAEAADAEAAARVYEDDEDLLSEHLPGVEDMPPAPPDERPPPTVAADADRTETVIVRDTPSGPVVEGWLVEPGPGGSTVPLQRRQRRRPSPYPRGGPAAGAAASGGTAVADPPETLASDLPPETLASDLPPDDAPPPGPTSAAEMDAAVADVDAAARTQRAEAATATEPMLAEADDDPLLADLITPYPSARPGPAGAIHGVGITLLVTDLARSIEFYRDLLGFFEIDSGEGNAVLASGETRLVLRSVAGVDPVNRRMVHLNLEVGDVHAVYEELKDKGVRFTYAPRPVNRGAKLELWAAAFRDPDGHGIAITQWRNRIAEETPGAD